MPLLNTALFHYVLIIVVSYAIASFSIPSIILVAIKRRLLDEPDDFRKMHSSRTPNLGGIAIFCAFAFSTAFFDTDKLLPSWNYLFAAALILFVIGLKDDIVGLSPVKKFGAQFLAAFVIAYFADIRLTDLQGFLGIHQLPMSISLVLTVVGIMFVTNAYNLIDGVDGLAGGLGLLAFSFFGAYFASVDNVGVASIALAMVGALLGFLRFNISPARIFMGDTGSLLLGFIIAALSIQFVEAGALHSVIAKSSSANLIIALSIIIIPVFDTFRVFANRILKGKSPFSADRTHIHHLLLDLGLSHAMASSALLSTNILFFSVAYLLKDSNPNLAAGILVALAIGLLQTLLYLHRAKAGREESQASYSLQIHKAIQNKPSRLQGQKTTASHPPMVVETATLAESSALTE